MFFLFFLASFLVITLYLGARFRRAFYTLLPNFLKKRIIYWLVFPCAVMVFPMASFLIPALSFYMGADLNVPPSIAYALSVFSALLIVAFVTTVTIDIAAFILSTLSPFKPIKAYFQKYPHRFGAIVLIAIAAHFGLAYYSAHSPKEVYYQVKVNKPIIGAQKTLRVVHLSDTHIMGATPTPYYQAVIERVNQLKPDLIVLTGDIVDRSVEAFLPFVTVFAQFKSRYGVYAVMGNHEYYGGAPDYLVSLYEKANMRVLRDEIEYIPEIGVTIIGRDDRVRGTNRMAQLPDTSAHTPRAALESLTRMVNHATPIFVMSHRPEELDISARLGVDIEFSGHTHNGQFFPINWIVAFLYQNPWGVWRKGDYTSIVSCGLGTWGPPIRSPSRAEIVVADATFSP